MTSSTSSYTMNYCTEISLAFLSKEHHSCLRHNSLWEYSPENCFHTFTHMMGQKGQLHQLQCFLSQEVKLHNPNRISTNEWNNFVFNHFFILISFDFKRCIMQVVVLNMDVIQGWVCGWSCMFYPMHKMAKRPWQISVLIEFLTIVLYIKSCLYIKSD